MNPHNEEFLARVVGAGAIILGVVGAVTVETVQTWSVVLIGIAFLLWREWRATQRQRRHDERIDEALEIIYRYNKEALLRKEKPPYPEFMPRPDDR